ncbi:MAG: hypothetical protein GX434_03360, partial [Peptococcaceae bacterium]|nr:hypothetical protein [Peptococcaceae bacterium]
MDNDKFQELVLEQLGSLGDKMDRFEGRQERLEAGQQEMRADIRQLQAGQEEMRTDIQQLQTGQRQLQAGQEEM